MSDSSDPNLIVAELGVGLLALAGLWRLIVWVREAPQRPDPWDAEIGRRLEEPEAVEICHHCFTQQPPNAWFCGHCGSAVGPYNNMMPYLNAFSTGEVLRNGVMDKLSPNALTVSGYLLLSVGLFFLTARMQFLSSLWPVLILTALLLYWFYFCKNLNRPREENPDAQQEGVSS